MTPDLKRLCEAIAEIDIGAGLHEVPIDDVYTATMLTSDGAEAIVRAVLAELREVSDGMYVASADERGAGDDGGRVRGLFEDEFAAAIDYILAEPATA